VLGLLAAKVSHVGALGTGHAVHAISQTLEAAQLLLVNEVPLHALLCGWPAARALRVGNRVLAPFRA
jgi:hypothetical protein